MAEIALTPKQRQQLKGAAHRLDPVVLLGANGLTDAVLKEIDRALAAHELIKVRAPGDDRVQRDQIFREIAERLGAARVQAIGKLFVLFRPRPEEASATESAPKPAPRRPARPIGRTARRSAQGKPGSRRR